MMKNAAQWTVGLCDMVGRCCLVGNGALAAPRAVVAKVGLWRRSHRLAAWLFRSPPSRLGV